jgi:hypothetical protein
MLTQTALVVTVEFCTSRGLEEVRLLQPFQQLVSTRAFDVACKNTNKIFLAIHFLTSGASNKFSGMMDFRP